MYAGIYDDESLYPITIVDTDDIQARVIVVHLIELGHIGYLQARTLTIGPLRCAIVPSLIKDHVNIDRTLPALARIVIEARYIISNQPRKKRTRMKNLFHFNGIILEMWKAFKYKT